MARSQEHLAQESNKLEDSVEYVVESGVPDLKNENEKNLYDTSSSVNDDLSENEIVKTRGVARIEAVNKMMHGTFFWMFAVSIWITTFVLALDSSTTTSYEPYATSSFNRHSMLSTLTIANSVIGAVCKPFIAKFSDLTSRPMTYLLVLVMYTVGFIISACSPTIAAYVIGSVFIAVGKSGLDLLNSIIVADMTKLKWRSLFTSFLSVPYLVTTWIAGYIAQDIIQTNWRWGYGMFAIITPVALSPAVICIWYLDHRANKMGEIPHGVDPLTQKKNEVAKENIKGFKAWMELLRAAMIEIDAFGLLLLGFAFSLILIPCSLYPYAKGQWNNPSMIAMEVVGGILLICYGIYEIWFAPFPLLPKRVLTNRTFICCVVIDFFYQMGGYFPLLYFTSYTRVVLNLSIRDWTYLSNTVTMGLCGFGVVWGVLFRVFRRYKVFQVTGIAIKLIGMGIYVSLSQQKNGPPLGLVIAGLLITCFGDAANVLGTQVAAQACVPHQDMAATISVLSLYSSIGAAIGSAIASAVWTDNLPGALRRHLADPAVAESYFEDISLIAATPWGTAERIGAIQAYQDVFYTLFCMGVGVSSIIFILALFQTNFYLGDQQNCVEGEQHEDYNYNEDGSKKTLLDRVTDFWKKPLY